MPGAQTSSHAGQNGSARRRRRRRPADDSDEDNHHSHNNGDDNDDDVSRLTNGKADDAPRAKRMRPSLQPGDADDADDADGDADETFYSTASGDGRRSSTRGGGGSGSNGSGAKSIFQPGAIVRVLVEDFVTYERAEFSPGPSLNMVIGPNGTGKSSLVCAICLGLGFPTSVLGRASAFGDFVRHGRSHAVVEIELQAGADDVANHAVRLRISREDNSRKFWLNGREVPLRRIQALMAQLRVQVDNLCQFLPQDRVAEFAGLSPVDLLAKTLEAAAPVDMKEMQAMLRDMYHKQRDAEQQLRADTDRLRSLESRHQAQQADVERYHEREEIERTIANLEACRPFVRFYEARAQYGELKEARRTANGELKALEDRLAPSLHAIDAKRVYQERLEHALETRRTVLRQAGQAADGALAELGRIDSRFRDNDDQRKDVATSTDNKRKEIAATRQKITVLEAKQKNRPQEFVAAEWNMKIREKEHEKREVEAERREIGGEMERIKFQAGRVMKEKQEAEQEISVLESRRGQQLSQLRRKAPDAAAGWAWLEKNQHLFEKEIFGPPMVTCSIKDPRYADLVQSLMQNDDFLCFTTQSVADHKKLSDQLYEQMGLSATIRTCTTPYSAYRPLLSAEELAALGFDGLAIDYIEGPEPVLAMLCAERRLNASPVGTQKLRPEQYDQVVAGERVSTWAAQDQTYRINRRREYGAHAVSTTVRDVHAGQFWREAQADGSETADLQRVRAEKADQLRELQEEMRALKERAAEPIRRAAELEAETEQLRSDKSQLQTEYNRWLALPEKIAAERTTLTRLREEHAALVEQRLALGKAGDALVLGRARAVLRHAEHVEVLQAAQAAVTEVQLRALEAASDVAGLEARNSDLVAQRTAQQTALAEVVRRMRELKTEGEAALEAAEQVAESGSERSDELHELAQGLATVAALGDEVAAERAKLDLTRVVDGRVLDEFRRRGREMEQLRAAMTTHADGCADLGRQIAAVRGRWEPRLDALIGRINEAFSYNFEQINCAGEVSVRKDEDDFERWAVEVRVRFREGEALQQLDQHRQSGGERAVSTIFYLMSLQGMAQAPFRVVDEINQGMDPRNERMMHERMVDIACHEHASQYFLITPKLLPGLRYDENMTVLCIASGQHVPDNEARLDFRRCMQIQRRLIAA